MSINFLEGNEAVALGAIKAGCSFFSGYPITPATSIYSTMVKLLPRNGGICIQGEDEIASIGFCLGASMAGKKVMTATSGPGISLYSEHISFAIGSEIPIVIVDVQRLGPSTGSATLGADGDIQFLQWGNSGGFPLIVLSPMNVKDCYTLTILAFNLSERYRCPAIIASNKEIALNRESVNLVESKEIKVENRKICDRNKHFLPFKISDSIFVPDFLEIGNKEQLIVRQTSSTHGVDGYITTSSEEIDKIQKRLKNKLNNLEIFGLNELYLENKAETLIVSYGITARSCKEIYSKKKGTDKPISLLILKILWPIPVKEIMQASKNIKRILVVEMNLGQYVLEIERIIKDKKIKFLGKMNGELISPEEIERKI